jgi:hypothetical protein
MSNPPTPVSDREIWHTACRVRRDQGDNALLFATQRCLHLRSAGNHFHLKIWERVAEVLHAMEQENTDIAVQPPLGMWTAASRAGAR